MGFEGYSTLSPAAKTLVVTIRPGGGKEREVTPAEAHVLLASFLVFSTMKAIGRDVILAHFCLCS